MAILAVNGLPLDVEYGTLKEERIHLGDFGDLSLSGRPLESRTGLVRRWSFTLTPFGTRTDGQPLTPNPVHLAMLARWIEGHGQVWSFNSATHSLSGMGVGQGVAGTFTRYATGGKHGGRLNVGSGSQFGGSLAHRLGVSRGWTPSQGWTLICHRNFQSGESATAGWHSVIMTGAVSFARGSAANPTGVTQYVDGVAGTYNLGRCFTVSDVSSPYVGIHGYLTTDSAAAVDYDDLAFFPFAIPSSWIGVLGAGPSDSLADFLNNYPLGPAPRVQVNGFAIDPVYGQSPVLAVGRVRRSAAVQIVHGAEVLNNLAQHEVQLTEWVP